MDSFKRITQGSGGAPAEQVIASLLSRGLNRGLPPARHQKGRMIFDLDDGRRLLVVPVREPRRPQVARAVQDAIREADDDPATIPSILVPHLTPAALEILEREGIAWFDLAGNGSLSVPGLHLHVEGRQPKSRRRGRPTSAFGPKGSRVARVLLIEPEERWTQKELVALTRLPQPTVSRALSRLQDLGLIRRDEERYYRVTSARDLLDAWSEEYDYSRHHITPIHLTGAGIGLARKLVGDLQGHGIRYALTGSPAAWLYDRFSQFRLGSCYIDGSPLDIVSLLGARVDEEGANFHLVEPVDDGVFFGAGEIDGVVCAHPVQVYLDLLHLPERASDAAEVLRRDWLRY